MKRVIYIIANLLAALSCLSCITTLDRDLTINVRPGSYGTSGNTRIESSESRNVLLLYSAGYTKGLPQYLRDDIKDLKEGWLPGNNRGDNVLLIYSHLPKTNYDLETPTSPVLFRLYSDESGQVVSDTLIIYPPGTISASALQMNKVMNYVKDAYPAKGYGMIFSSHGTGYLPAGFYSNPSAFSFKESPKRRPGLYNPSPVPYMDRDFDPSMPAVKSLGADVDYSSGSYMSYEMELDEFAEAIPMKLDYLLFDACLMGGVEVAYELRDKCGMVGGSQTEVLAEGLDYTTLARHLLGSRTPDPLTVCKDFFLQYDNDSGVYRSATISVINPSRMESLVQICKTLFMKYRNGLNTLEPGRVQRYFRSNHHWFYDLESIIFEAASKENTKTEITNADIAALRAALDECIIYKAATPMFMNEFHINTYSGLSMYLPSNGTEYLDAFYRRLSWNSATSLVE